MGFVAFQPRDLGSRWPLLPPRVMLAASWRLRYPYVGTSHLVALPPLSPEAVVARGLELRAKKGPPRGDERREGFGVVLCAGPRILQRATMGGNEGLWTI